MKQYENPFYGVDPIMGQLCAMKANGFSNYWSVYGNCGEFDCSSYQMKSGPRHH